MRGTTIAEVAAEAGVGVGTVSRVLNGSPAVSEETRKRVLEAIVALDYQPSAAARALSTGRTHAIGVVASFFLSASVVERLRGVVGTLTEAGYQLVLVDVERPEHVREAFRPAAVRGRFDGVLAVSLAPTEAEARRLERSGIPIVLVDHPHERLPTVTIDDVAGGRLAAEHLLALGHRRIAYLGDLEIGDGAFEPSARRREGFQAALAGAGVGVPPEWLLQRPIGRAIARRAIGELLSGPELPTAIFATSDVAAIGAIEAARAAGIAVPGQLSVIGFDDVEVAELTALTTVAQPLRASGALAAELLLRQLAGEQVMSRPLDVRLMERATTAPPAIGQEQVRGTRDSQRVSSLTEEGSQI